MGRTTPTGYTFWLNAKAVAMLDLLRIPGGAFWMGSNVDEVHACVDYWGPKLVDPSYDIVKFHQWILKEFPKHLVRIEAFCIGRFPVTNQEYVAFVEASGCDRPESLVRREPAAHPVWGVPFENAMSYATWLSRKSGCPLRLPTEAEWEYAARGPSSREYPFGPEFDPVRCNTIESGIGHTTPIDRYPDGVSEFGVWDLAGNVEEWTMDFYEPYPGGSYVHDDLSVHLGGRYRVLRGGSFARGGDLARCARRHGPFPAAEFRYTGFRLAIDGAR